MSERIIKQHDQISRAIDLIRRGYRTKIVYLETGVPQAKIRSIHKELFGRSPWSGQLPEAERILNTRVRAIDASLLIHLYRKVYHLKAEAQIDIDALSMAHDAYKSLREEWGMLSARDPIDVNEAWVLARDLRSRHLVTSVCPTCGFHYVWSVTQERTPSCPTCSLSAESRRSSEKNHILDGYVIGA